MKVKSPYKKNESKIESPILIKVKKKKNQSNLNYPNSNHPIAVVFLVVVVVVAVVVFVMVVVVSPKVWLKEINVSLLICWILQFSGGTRNRWSLCTNHLTVRSRCENYIYLFIFQVSTQFIVKGVYDIYFLLNFYSNFVQENEPRSPGLCPHEFPRSPYAPYALEKFTFHKKVISHVVA